MSERRRYRADLRVRRQALNTGRDWRAEEARRRDGAEKAKRAESVVEGDKDDVLFEEVTWPKEEARSTAGRCVMDMLLA